MSSTARSGARPPAPVRKGTASRLATTLCALAFLALAGAGPAPAQDALDRTEPYRYTVIEQSLRAALENFGSNIGVPVDIADGVEGRVSGPLPEAPPRAFLDRLARLYNFTYYYDGRVLNITPSSANESRLLELDRVDFASLAATLEALGIADERFMVRSAQNGSVALVNGPPRYVALVEATLTALTSVRTRQAARDAAEPEPEPDPAPPAPPAPTVIIQREAPRPDPADGRPLEPSGPPLIVYRGSSVEVLPNGRPERSTVRTP